MTRLGRVREASVLLTLLAAACGSEPVRQEAGQNAPAPQSGVLLVVTDETGGNLVVIDPEAGNVVDRIPVGKRPRGLRQSPDGAHVLVALSGSPIAGPGVDESTLPPAGSHR